MPQAMFQVGDVAKYFRGYYPKLVKVLLDHQDKDGSWLAGGGNDRSGGRVYCTSMAVLALAIEYRYLPIYQRRHAHGIRQLSEFLPEEGPNVPRSASDKRIGRAASPQLPEPDRGGNCPGHGSNAPARGLRRNGR